MNEMILLKLGELVLKGLNRRSFEDKLQANIYRRLDRLGQFRVYTRQSTTYVEPQSPDCDMDAAYEAMKHVFGVIGLSRAKACEKTKEAMLETAKSGVFIGVGLVMLFWTILRSRSKSFWSMARRYSAGLALWSISPSKAWGPYRLM